MTRFQSLETLTQLLIFYCFSLFFSCENFPFSSFCIFTSVLSFRQVWICKSSTTADKHKNSGEKHTLSSSDIDFETFGVLGTTLNEICYVKFEMAKSRCCAKAFFYVRKLKTLWRKRARQFENFSPESGCKTLPLWWILHSTWIIWTNARPQKTCHTVLRHHMCIQVEVVLVGDNFPVMTLLISFV